MGSGIFLPPVLETSVRAFLAEAAIPLAVLPEVEAPVRVLPAEEGPRREADAATLPAGGTIRCAVALGMAPRLGIGTKELGRLLNHLDIKVHDCSLGCFP